MKFVEISLLAFSSLILKYLGLFLNPVKALLTKAPTNMAIATPALILISYVSPAVISDLL